MSNSLPVTPAGCLYFAAELFSRVCGRSVCKGLQRRYHQAAVLRCRCIFCCRISRNTIRYLYTILQLCAFRKRAGRSLAPRRPAHFIRSVPSQAPCPHYTHYLLIKKLPDSLRYLLMPPLLNIPYCKVVYKYLRLYTITRDTRSPMAAC